MPWGPWVDLKYDEEDRAEDAMNSPAAISFGREAKDQYPWGTRLSLTDRELRKMNCEAKDFKVGELIDLRAMGTVTAIRQEADDRCCVEIQLEKITCEDEDTEVPPGPHEEEEEHAA